jgi:hypothetical protein
MRFPQNPIQTDLKLHSRPSSLPLLSSRGGTFDVAVAFRVMIRVVRRWLPSRPKVSKKHAEVNFVPLSVVSVKSSSRLLSASRSKSISFRKCMVEWWFLRLRATDLCVASAHVYAFLEVAHRWQNIGLSLRSSSFCPHSPKLVRIRQKCRGIKSLRDKSRRNAPTNATHEVPPYMPPERIVRIFLSADAR